MKTWANENNPYFSQVHLEGGDCTYILGSHQYYVKRGKEKAEWDDFFEKLLNLRFIDIDKKDKQGHPYFKLKKVSFDFIDQHSLKTE